MKMETDIKECLRRGRGMEKESMYLLMEQHIKDNGKMEELKEKAFVLGRMAENMKVNG